MAKDSKSHSYSAMADAFIMDVAMGAYYLAGPLYAIRLGASPVELGWLGAGCALAYMVVAGLAGHLIGGISGRIRAVAGALIFGVAAAVGPGLDAFFPFLLVYALGSAGMAVFWTGLESVLIHPEIGIMESARRFNVAWSSGFIFGPLVSGVLAEHALFWAFRAVAVLCLCCAGFSFLIPADAGREHHSLGRQDWETVSPYGAASFLKVAFMANFCFWIINGMLRYIFPEIGLRVGFDETGIALMLSLWALTQATAFHVLGRWRGWPYRGRWLFGAQLAAVAVLVALGFWPNKLLHVISFAAIGALGALPYASSLVYALADRRRHNVLVGYHEALIYAGSFTGSLVGGWSLERLPLLGASRLGRLTPAGLPYLATAALVTLGVAAQALLLRALRRRDPGDAYVKDQKR